jgi:glycolate dehydrogenase FAD-binding subunit
MAPPETATKPSAELLAPEFGAIVGKEHVRPATPADAVDGVQPQIVIEPGSSEELAKTLQRAATAGLHVVPRGGGTKLGWGNPPRTAEVILSIARLNHVLEHAWADMTATVEAGCTVAQFQRALAEHGQRLALDPLWPERATIGGILATNDSGASRVRFGSLRDLIIGVTLALPDGTLAKSGGKVVKNVAGYDLPKLATGSFGTLGVITQAVFRLYPLPRETRSASFRAASADALNQLMLAVQDSWLVPTGMQLRAEPGATAELDIRFEGTSPGIEAQLSHLSQLAKGTESVQTPQEAWNAREALWGVSERALIAKFSVLPAQLSAACRLVQRTAEPLGLSWKVVAQAVGLGTLRLDGTSEPLIAAVTNLRSELERLGGSLGVQHCPAALKARLDVWGPAGDTLPLMRRIKEELDPAGALNPGRFVGGI